MKDLLTVVLATAWVLGVIRYMGTRRHLRETPDHIDRDFRNMVARVHHSANSGLSGPWYMTPECPDHGPTCSRKDGDGALICAFSRAERMCRLNRGHSGLHDTLDRDIPHQARHEWEVTPDGASPD